MTAVVLIGDPVAGSVSPAMHRAGFVAAGLDLDYRILRVTRKDLPEVLPRLRETCAGLNVTIPLKEAILPLLDRVGPEAAGGGSVNTVVLRGGTTEGRSTDGAGFLAALRRSGAPPARRAAVLGTGGAARAVAAALVGEGCAVTVWGRNAVAGGRIEADGLAAYAGAAPGPLAAALEDADLLANATPVGAGSASTPLPPGTPLHPGLTVVDLVYRPRRTALLVQAAEAGCRTVEGVEMLVEQGALSFELWTGVPAPAEVMREAALRALDRPDHEVPA